MKSDVMRTDVSWITLIILSTLLTVSSLVPKMAGYVIVLFVYVTFLLWLVNTGRFVVVCHWEIISLILLIWATFALTTVLNPTAAGVLRFGAFTVITGINLFVVPAVIERKTFHNVLATIAGIAVLIGLPTVLLGSYEIAGFTITPWDTTQTLAGVVVHTPISIFDNPNHLAGFAAMGVVASAAMFVRSRKLLTVGVFGLNTLGVVLAGSRAALLALVAASGLYVVYGFFGRAAMAGFVAFGAFAVVAGFAMVFEIIPGPDAIAQVNLGDRRATWSAAYEAVRSRPLLGWGPGNDAELLADYLRDSVDITTTHNSYIRMFLISGILGGGAYLVLTINTLAMGIRNARSETIFTVLLMVAFLIIQLFEGMTIFGLSLLSTLGALFVGYVQSSAPASKTATVTEVRRRIVGYARNGLDVD